MPLFRVVVTKMVPAELEFTIQAASSAEAEDLAKAHPDPDSSSIDLASPLAQYTRTRYVDQLPDNQDDNPVVAVVDNEDDYCEQCNEHFEDCTCNQCYECHNHIDDCECCIACERYECVCNICPDCDKHVDDCTCHDEDESEDEELTAEELTAEDIATRACALVASLSALAAADDDDDSDRSDEGAEAEDSVGGDFGPDDANWTHDVRFNIRELPDAAKAAFDHLVASDDLDRLYDLVWSAGDEYEAAERLKQYLTVERPLEQSDLVAREYALNWAQENQPYIGGLVNAIALLGRETVTCKGCGKSVPSRTAHAADNEWVGNECCWDLSVP